MSRGVSELQVISVQQWSFDSHLTGAIINRRDGTPEHRKRRRHQSGARAFTSRLGSGGQVCGRFYESTPPHGRMCSVHNTPPITRPWRTANVDSGLAERPLHADCRPAEPQCSARTGNAVSLVANVRRTRTD